MKRETFIKLLATLIYKELSGECTGSVSPKWRFSLVEDKDERKRFEKMKEKKFSAIF